MCPKIFVCLLVSLFVCFHILCRFWLFFDVVVLLGFVLILFSFACWFCFCVCVLPDRFYLFYNLRIDFCNELYRGTPERSLVTKYPSSDFVPRDLVRQEPRATGFVQ